MNKFYQANDNTKIMNIKVDKTTIITLSPYLILITLVIAFFYREIFLGYGFFWRDIFNHSYPAKWFFADCIKNGYLPLWNPYIQLGQPHLADLSNQTLYFLNVLFLILPAKLAINYTIIIEFCLCALFTFLFAKDLTSNKIISIFSAISFTFCGYCISLSCNLEYLSSITWLPALFWSFYRCLETNKRIYIVLSSLFLSMFIFCGDPSSYYFIVGFLFLRCLFNIKDKKLALTSLKLTFLIVLLSLGISAIQLIPSFELIGHSVRSEGIDFDKATIWSTHPLRLIEGIFPFFFGHHFPDLSAWAGRLYKTNLSDYSWAESIYIGVIPAFLAIFSFFFKQSKDRYFWLSVVCISLLIALGHHIPIYEFLFNTLPGFSSFRYPEKLLLFSSFGIIILATYGFKDLTTYTCDSPKNLKPLLFIFLLILAIVVNINITTYFNLENISVTGLVSPDIVNLNFKLKIMYFAIIAAIFTISLYCWCNKKISTVFFFIFICALCYFDLALTNTNAYISSKLDYFKGHNTIATTIKENWDKQYPPRILIDQYPNAKLTTEYLKYKAANTSNKNPLKEIHENIFTHYLMNIRPNMTITFHIDTINTHSALCLNKVKECLDYFEDKLDIKNPYKPFNINYIMDTPLMANYYEHNNHAKKIRKSIQYSEVLLKTYDPTPKAFIVYNSKFFTDDNLLKETFFSDEFNLNDTVLLSGIEKNSCSTLNIKQETVIIEKYLPNYVKIKTFNNNNGYLVLLDAYYPGWMALIDNKEVEILNADYIYRTIKLNKGTHKVEFIFDPASIKIGGLISLCSLIFCVIFCRLKSTL